MTGTTLFVVRILHNKYYSVSVQGRSVVVFLLAVVGVTKWIKVVSGAIHQVTKMPILVIFYSLGYAAGNGVGIVVESRLAMSIRSLKPFTARWVDGGSGITVNSRQRIDL